MLWDGVGYAELGANYYDARKKDAVVHNTIKRLGYKATVEAA